jgi:hypothetical protein
MVRYTITLNSYTPGPQQAPNHGGGALQKKKKRKRKRKKEKKRDIPHQTELQNTFEFVILQSIILEIK